MPRYIDAEKLKFEVFLSEENISLNPAYSEDYKRGWNQAMKSAMKEVTNAPIVEPQRPHGEWIPCSERLPDKDGKYLVTRTSYITRKPEVSISIFVSTTKEFYPEGIAWTTLPEPYKKEGDENG